MYGSGGINSLLIRAELEVIRDGNPQNPAPHRMSSGLAQGARGGSVTGQVGGGGSGVALCRASVAKQSRQGDAKLPITREYADTPIGCGGHSPGRNRSSRGHRLCLSDGKRGQPCKRPQREVSRAIWPLEAPAYHRLLEGVYG
eukprot:1695013-Amphidinium_carterae.2